MASARPAPSAYYPMALRSIGNCNADRYAQALRSCSKHPHSWSRTCSIFFFHQRSWPPRRPRLLSLYLEYLDRSPVAVSNLNTSYRLVIQSSLAISCTLALEASVHTSRRPWSIQRRYSVRLKEPSWPPIRRHQRLVSLGNPFRWLIVGQGFIPAFYVLCIEKRQFQRRRERREPLAE